MDLSSHWQSELQAASTATTNAMARADRANEIVQRQSEIIAAQQKEVDEMKLKLQDYEFWQSSKCVEGDAKGAIEVDETKPNGERQPSVEVVDHCDDALDEDALFDGEATVDDQSVDAIVGGLSDDQLTKLVATEGKHKARSSKSVRGKCNKTTAERVVIARRVIRMNMTSKQAAEEFNMPESSIRRWMTNLPAYEQALVSHNSVSSISMGRKRGGKQRYPILHAQLHDWLDKKHGGKLVDFERVRKQVIQFAAENAKAGVMEKTGSYENFNASWSWVRNMMNRYQKK